MRQSGIGQAIEEDRQPLADHQGQVEAALAAIQSAFGGLGRPDRRDLLASSHNHDVTDMLDSFGDCHWRDLSRSVLAMHREVLAILQPRAFQFYLPAYLVASLQPGEALADIREHTLHALRRADGEPAVRFERKISLLTPQQKDAVRAFTRAVASDQGPWRDHGAVLVWNK